MKIRRSSRSGAAQSTKWTMLIFFACLLAMASLTATPASAQTIAERFPEPAQIAAAYPDEASRFVALKVLYGTLSEKTTGRSPGAYAKSSAYMQAMQQISMKYDLEQPNTPAAKEFSNNVGKLLGSASFPQSVLERYGLTDLSSDQTAPPPTSQSPLSGSSQDAEAKRLIFFAAPIWILTLVLMGFLPRIIWKATGQLGGSKAPGTNLRLDSGQLPESLREFRILGSDYQAELRSGRVIEEKTWSEAHVSSVTTPATYQVTGDQVYKTGGGTTVSSTTVTKDRVWLRTLNNGETAWTFSGGKFVARQGQLLSAIVRPLPNGTSEFLAAFNHSTGQFEAYRPSAVGETKLGTMLPWIVTTLLGTVGFVFGVALLLIPSMTPAGLFSPQGLMAATLIVVRGGIVSLIGAAITGRVLIGVVRGKISSERGFRFERDLKPAYLRFLQESTPAISQSLASI